jgi:hypothetical protein
MRYDLGTVMMCDGYDIAFSWYESLFGSSGALVGGTFLDDCGIGAATEYESCAEISSSSGKASL